MTSSILNDPRWNTPSPERYEPCSFRSRLVFVEGLDCCGKSTLCHRARFETGHNVLFYDRGPLGRIVMSKVFHDGYPEWQMEQLERRLIASDAYALVFLNPSLDVIQQRMRETGHVEIPSQILMRTIFTYKEEFRRRGEAPFHMASRLILQIDNSNLSSDETLERVLAWAETSRIPGRSSSSGQNSSTTGS